MKLMILFIGLSFGINFVLAEITFFEGNYNEDFIMIGKNNVDGSSVYCGNAICDSGETCSSCKVDCGVCSGGSFEGGSGLVVRDDGFEEEENFSEGDVSRGNGFLYSPPKEKIFPIDKIILGLVLVSILFLVVLLINKLRKRK